MYTTGFTSLALIGILCCTLFNNANAFVTPSSSFSKTNTAIFRLYQTPTFKPQYSPNFSKAKLESMYGPKATTASKDALPASIGAGVVTGALGFLCAQILSKAAPAFWKKVPAMLIKRGITMNPIYAITGVFAVGGLLMGLLSMKPWLAFASSSSAPAPARKASAPLSIKAAATAITTDAADFETPPNYNRLPATIVAVLPKDAVAKSNKAAAELNKKVKR